MSSKTAQIIVVTFGLVASLPFTASAQSAFSGVLQGRMLRLGLLFNF